MGPILEIRQPIRYDRWARCTLKELESVAPIGASYRYVDDPEQKVASILQHGAGTAPFSELTIQQRDSQFAEAQLRSRWFFFRDKAIERVQTALNKCARGRE